MPVFLLTGWINLQLLTWGSVQYHFLLKGLLKLHKYIHCYHKAEKRGEFNCLLNRQNKKQPFLLQLYIFKKFKPRKKKGCKKIRWWAALQPLLRSFSISGRNKTPKRQNQFMSWGWQWKNSLSITKRLSIPHWPTVNILPHLPTLLIHTHYFSFWLNHYLVAYFMAFHP